MHFFLKYSTSLYFPEFISVCTILCSFLCCLGSKNESVVLFYRRCFLKWRNWLSVKSIVKASLGMYGDWSGVVSVQRSDSCLAHNNITSGSQSGEICSLQWTHTDKTQPFVAFKKQGKAKIMKSDLICCFPPSLAPFLLSHLGQFESTMQGIIGCLSYAGKALFFFFWSL